MRKKETISRIIMKLYVFKKKCLSSSLSFFSECWRCQAGREVLAFEDTVPFARRMLPETGEHRLLWKKMNLSRLRTELALSCALQTMPARPRPVAFLTLAASAPSRAPSPGRRRRWRRLPEPTCRCLLAKEMEETPETAQESAVLREGSALPQPQADGPRSAELAGRCSGSRLRR